jgi:hypothetical protein
MATLGQKKKKKGGKEIFFSSCVLQIAHAFPFCFYYLALGLIRMGEERSFCV